MKRVIHHVKKHGKKVHQHVKKHHKKYIFGAISGALVYKTLSLIAATIVGSSVGVGFASGTVDTGSVNTGVILTGDFFVNDDDSSTTGLDVTLNNEITGATHMRFGNTESDMNIASWDTFSENKFWTLDDNGTGTKTVYAQFSGTDDILSLQDTIDYLPEAEPEELSGDLVESGTIDSGFIEDITPDLFSFNNISSASITTEYFSNTVTIEGINTGAEISITNGAYKINSDSRTGTDGIIYSGDTLQIKMFSSDSYSDSEIATVTVGDIDVDWTVITAGSNGICDSSDITITNPSEDDIFKGEFDIERSYGNSDCDGDELTIKLRDANSQYVTIGTADYNNDSITFDSALLYSGFYNITGLDLSGNVVTIHTGDYTGDNTYFFTGHKIAILNSSDDVMYEGEYFTIDNEAPTLDNIGLDYSNTNSGHVGIGETIDLTFDSSEELSGATVTILGVYADSVTNTGGHYEYSLDLSDDNTEGTIIYNIEFTDFAGNTGYIEGTDTIIFDKTLPELDNITFTNNSGLIDINIVVDEISELNFEYLLSGSQTGGTFNSEYSQSHNHTITGLLENQYYNYTISISDIADNLSYFGGYFMITGDTIDYTNEAIYSGDMIVTLGFNEEEDQEEEEVVETRPATTFRTEIDKFNQCKETIGDVSNIEIPVRKYKARLEMPEMEKTYVRKLVSAFSIVLFERIETAGLTEDEINQITKEFNNFLVILKLVRDDENECEQNLSNYYMSKFRKSLLEYNLATK